MPETLGAADLDPSADMADRAVTAHYIIAVKQNKKKKSQFIPGSKTGCQSKHSNQSKRAEALSPFLKRNTRKENRTKGNKSQRKRCDEGAWLTQQTDKAKGERMADQ